MRKYYILTSLKSFFNYTLFYSIKYESPAMARIKNKTKIGYWDNDIVDKTAEAVQSINLTEPVLVKTIPI